MLTKEEVIKIKTEYGNLISYNSNITRESVYEALYEVPESIKVMGFSYFHQNVYDVSRGDFNCGIKYTLDGETYYMFVGGNTGYAHPQTISVGKAKEGKIYLIWENYPEDSCTMQLRIIDEEYTLKNNPGHRPASYRKQLFSYGGYLEQRIKELNEAINDRDMECIQIALEGVMAFSDLIGVILPDFRKPESKTTELKYIP